MREDILAGKLELPGYDVFVCNFSDKVVDVVADMWSSLWHNYMSKLGSTSSLHWLEQAGPEYTREYLQCLNILQVSGWIRMDTRDNYSAIHLVDSKLLEFVSEEELIQTRFNNRFIKYLPYADSTNQYGLATVCINGKKTENKLWRPGSQLGAKSTFSFDRTAMIKHIELVQEQARKGIDKTVIKHECMLDDEANYSDIMDSIIEHLANEDVVCNMGKNHCDSRGRAIKSNLDKVMNPIGFKVARALLVIPE